ncbi:hypothetical protein CSA80_03590 [Candidatus Saccharibacteria bacterium]|nr:MAG: hypothetical protein CSA80_03590 [Candidatus Saccharibacteria bacterium]
MARRDNIAIKVDHASKSFRLPHDKQNSIKGGLISLARGKKRTYETQEVLKDISFEIKKGEFFGIVGRNGSGKSTLLKMLAGIYTTTSGDIQINGSLTPFIELGVGFNPDLTGRDNVFLNGALLGFNREEMSEMYDDIVEFAELERFMDQKLKNYSSGMQVRLAFSIAIRAQSDILLLDEVLAVGDEAFQRKCFQYFAKLKRNKKTVVLVTHSMESVRKYCSKAMLVVDGRVKLFGDPNEIADEYTGINLLQEGAKEKVDTHKPMLSAKIVGKRTLTNEDTLKVEIKYKALDTRPVTAKAYIDFRGQAIMATNPVLLGWDEMITRDTKQHTAMYELSLENFNKGEYKVVALLEDIETKVNIARYGYEGGSTVIVIDNRDTSSSGGLLINHAKMRLHK